MARVYSIEKVKNLFTKVSLSNQYKLEINIGEDLKNSINGDGIYLRGDSQSFGGLNEKVSVMCRATELPGQSLETVPLYGSRQGVFEIFPTTRRFTALNCTFYLDKDHDVLRFFERWMNYINPLVVPTQGIAVSSLDEKNVIRGASTSDAASFFRMKHKDKYATTLILTKFEKDSMGDNDRFRPKASKFEEKVDGLTYTFYRAFPREITSVPISYDNADVVQFSVLFEYERFRVS